MNNERLKHTEEMFRCCAACVNLEYSMEGTRVLVFCRNKNLPVEFFNTCDNFKVLDSMKELYSRYSEELPQKNTTKCICDSEESCDKTKSFENCPECDYNDLQYHGE
jgi:hypothetical protein